MPKKLYRIEEGKMLTGVCGGLAEYFNVDCSIVRLVTVIAACASLGMVFWGYIIASIIVPTKSSTF